MKVLVNTYILLFLLDGIVSLINALAGRLWGMQPLLIPQGMIAFLVVVLSGLLYLLIGCMRHFPKRVVLPLAVFSLWAGLFFALPVPIFLGLDRTIILLSLIQPCLGLAMIMVLRYSARNEHWLYRKPDFAHLSFQWKRLAGFAVAHVLLVVPLLAVWLAMCLGLAVSHFSSGFIHLDTRGVSVEARTYVCDDKHILLLPTVHIAQPAFYKRLTAPLPVDNTVVIPEGVTDEQQLLAGSLDYNRLAERVGLEVQDNEAFVAKRPTVHCDVDVSEFSDQTIRYLRTCAEVIRHWEDGNALTALQRCTAASSLDLDLLWKDLLDLRNERVTTCITDCLQTYDTVVIPWGAAHMPGIQRTILTWGATLTERRRVSVWNWLSPPKAASNDPRAGALMSAPPLCQTRRKRDATQLWRDL